MMRSLISLLTVTCVLARAAECQGNDCPAQVNSLLQSSTPKAMMEKSQNPRCVWGDWGSCGCGNDLKKGKQRRARAGSDVECGEEEGRQEGVNGLKTRRKGTKQVRNCLCICVKEQGKPIYGEPQTKGCEFSRDNQSACYTSCRMPNGSSRSFTDWPCADVP